LYISFLFGFIPASLLKVFEKKSFIVGGLLLVVAHVLAAVMITYTGNRKAIMNNSSLYTFLIAVLGGQGASLIFIATLQSVLSSMTVVCTHFTASLIVAYFFGSTVIFLTLAQGVFGSMTIWIIIGLSVVVYIAANHYLPESEEESSVEIAKCVLNKRTAGGHLLIQLIITILLVLVYAYDWEYSAAVGIVLLVLWLLNLAVPLLLLALLDEEAIKEMVGMPSEIETHLVMNKGKEGEPEADFWMFAIAAAFSVGLSFTSLEQAGPLSLRNSTTAYDMIQLQQVMTVVGATLTGFILLYGRNNTSPAALFSLGTFFSILASIHMWYLEGRRDQYILEQGLFICNGLALGTQFVCMASYCFEEFGKTGFAHTFGLMMTFAALAFVICDELVFQWTFDAYAGRQKEDGWHRLYFGNWSEAVAFYYLIIEIALFIVGIFAWRTWSERQVDGVLGAAFDAAKDLAKNVEMPKIGF